MRLQARAVEVVNREFCSVDVREATQVNGNTRFPVLVSPAREGVNAAVSAEEMMNSLVVKLIVAQSVFTRKQAESVAVYEA